MIDHQNSYDAAHANNHFYSKDDNNNIYNNNNYKNNVNIETRLFLIIQTF